MSEITRKPTRFGVALSLSAALLASVVAGVAAVGALAVGLLGTAILAVALARGSHRTVSVAGAALAVAVLLAGAGADSPEPVLAAAVAAVMAWDLGTNAVTVGEQLGRETRTARLEAFHAAASLGVGALVVGVGYGVYLTATGGQPVAALLFLLAGTVALVGALR